MTNWLNRTFPNRVDRTFYMKVCLLRVHTHTHHFISEYSVVLFEFVAHVTHLSTDHLRSQGSVRTLQFILFLYIQQIHKISFKASLVSGGEEYPCFSVLSLDCFPFTAAINLHSFNELNVPYSTVF